MKIPTGSVPANDPNFAGYAIEFRNQVEFLKKTAKLSWDDSSAATKDAEEYQTGLFREINEPFEAFLEALSFRDFKKPDAALLSDLTKAAVFIYLFQKVNEMHEACQRINKDGLYALFGTVRSWTYRFLGSGLLTRPYDMSIKEYLSVESFFVACAEMTDVEMIPIHEAASQYQDKVFKRLDMMIKEGEAAEAKSKTAKKSGPKGRSSRKKGKAGAKKASAKRNAPKKSKKAKAKPKASKKTAPKRKKKRK